VTASSKQNRAAALEAVAGRDRYFLHPEGTLSDAVVHVRPHAHLYAWTHTASSLTSSVSVHGTSAAEYLQARERKLGPARNVFKKGKLGPARYRVHGICVIALFS
jgi:hypothetical protein